MGRGLKKQSLYWQEVNSSTFLALCWWPWFDGHQQVARMDTWYLAPGCSHFLDAPLKAVTDSAMCPNQFWWSCASGLARSSCRTSTRVSQLTAWMTLSLQCYICTYIFIYRYIYTAYRAAPACSRQCALSLARLAGDSSVHTGQSCRCTTVSAICMSNASRHGEFSVRPSVLCLCMPTRQDNGRCNRQHSCQGLGMSQAGFSRETLSLVVAD